MSLVESIRLCCCHAVLAKGLSVGGETILMLYQELHCPCVLVFELSAIFQRDLSYVLLNLDNVRKDINSMRAAVEQRGVLALPCGIIDNRRSAKDKVELLPQHPGSEIFVANR